MSSSIATQCRREAHEALSMGLPLVNKKFASFSFYWLYNSMHRLRGIAKTYAQFIDTSMTTVCKRLCARKIPSFKRIARTRIIHSKICCFITYSLIKCVCVWECRVVLLVYNAVSHFAFPFEFSLLLIHLIGSFQIFDVRSLINVSFVCSVCTSGWRRDRILSLSRANDLVINSVVVALSFFFVIFHFMFSSHSSLQLPSLLFL